MEGSREGFDDRSATAPLTREGPFGSGEPVQTRVYAPGRRGAGGGTTETRPFFLTSEFLATLLAVIALAITAGVMDIVNARLTWILTAALVVGYVVSRGLAKAGTRSSSSDPREALLERGGDGGRAQAQPVQRQRAVGGYRHGGRYGMLPLETRPFFLTSEFLATLFTIIALGITAAANDLVNARLTWMLTAGLVATYAVSRGLAKAGSRSHSVDPRDTLLGDEGGAGESHGSYGDAARHAVETKPFFMTSEFLGTLVAIVAIAISAATIDILNARLTWILITVMVGGYVLSRGIAKIGVPNYGFDPRDALLHRAFDGTTRR